MEVKRNIADVFLAIAVESITKLTTIQTFAIRYRFLRIYDLSKD